jgi:hypothetical protein
LESETKGIRGFRVIVQGEDKPQQLNASSDEEPLAATLGELFNTACFETGGALVLLRLLA